MLGLVITNSFTGLPVPIFIPPHNSPYSLTEHPVAAKSIRCIFNETSQILLKNLISGLKKTKIIKNDLKKTQSTTSKRPLRQKQDLSSQKNST
jgi:hypothetical protein